MNLRPDQLAAQLQRELKAVYLVSGDEPLQTQEACDLIRAKARAEGFSERELFEVETQFKWDQFLAASNALSLFASRKLIELRLHSNKMPAEGAKAILSYLERPSPDNLLLVCTPKLDKATQNSAWCKALSNTGAHIQVWPINRQQLPGWIQQRLRQQGLQADTEAVALLADWVDGNLLAAVQEIEKLKLLCAPQEKLSVATLRAAMTDSARYDPFDLIDAALRGDAAQCLKMIRGLANEGVSPHLLLSGLSREIKQLSLIAYDCAQGHGATESMQRHHVWSNRQALVGSAIKRLSVGRLHSLAQELLRADRILKGAEPGDLWQQLETICLGLTGIGLGTAQVQEC